MYESFNNASLFIVSALFNLYLTVLVIRLILAWERADYFNPITRFIIQITQPIIKPLRSVLPTYKGIEFSTVVVILVLQLLKDMVMSLLLIGMPPVSVLLLIAAKDSMLLLLNTFFYAIFLNAILSWVQPGFSPLGQVLEQLSRPIMQPLRRWIPPIGGFDLTPIPALLGLKFLIMVIQ